VKAFFDSLEHIDHIQTLVDACERDTEWLEYKKASEPFTDTNEISKDVSAFANSSGGVIIYGVSTDRQDKTKPVLIEGVHAKNRETFDRVVNSRIQPPIQGLQIKMIPQDSPQVTVVYVPPSDGAPHQNAGDHKYYRRAASSLSPCPMISWRCISAEGRGRCSRSDSTP
jgi:predicted HTH transcriptional regulator